MYPPRTAPSLAVRVIVLPEAVGFGKKVAVTPLGKFLAESRTLPMGPFCVLTETGTLAEVPRPSCVLPFTESVKAGPLDVTVTFSRDEAVTLPYVPVTTTLYCPRVAESEAVKVNVLGEFVGLGENDPVTPLGKPVIARFTFPLNPFSGST
jgi:hypothetical protein